MSSSRASHAPSRLPATPVTRIGRPAGSTVRGAEASAPGDDRDDELDPRPQRAGRAARGTRAERRGRRRAASGRGSRAAEERAGERAQVPGDEEAQLGAEQERRTSARVVPTTTPNASSVRKYAATGRCRPRQRDLRAERQPVEHVAHVEEERRQHDRERRRRRRRTARRRSPGRCRRRRSTESDCVSRSESPASRAVTAYASPNGDHAEPQRHHRPKAAPKCRPPGCPRTNRS